MSCAFSNYQRLQIFSKYFCPRKIY